jgi:hypothetical protein
LGDARYWNERIWGMKGPNNEEKRGKLQRGTNMGCWIRLCHVVTGPQCPLTFGFCNLAMFVSQQYWCHNSYVWMYVSYHGEYIRIKKIHWNLSKAILYSFLQNHGDSDIFTIISNIGIISHHHVSPSLFMFKLQHSHMENVQLHINWMA